MPYKKQLAAFLRAAAGAKCDIYKCICKKAYLAGKETSDMKKSTLISILVFMAAVAGALGAAYVYLLRREKELDEYEQMLFSEDFSHECPCDDCSGEDKPDNTQELSF